MIVGIILAGGTGSRIGARIPKQFIKILGKPVLAYTLEIFQRNKNIDAIEVVYHKDWGGEVDAICDKYGITKKRWTCTGGNTFQESCMNGIFNLQGKIKDDDIVVISFGTSPMTPQEDIDDSIRVCKMHGNAIASVDMDLCTCIKDDEESTTQNIFRETLKGFANPWTFNYGELYGVYQDAIEKGIFMDIEPHTTSLYLAQGKRLWFSKSTALLSKITKRSDLDIFEGYLLLEKSREKSKESILKKISDAASLR